MIIEGVYRVRGRGPVFAVVLDEVLGPEEGDRLRRRSDGRTYPIRGVEWHALPRTPVRPGKGDRVGLLLPEGAELAVGDEVELDRAKLDEPRLIPTRGEPTWAVYPRSSRIPHEPLAVFLYEADARTFAEAATAARGICLEVRPCASAPSAPDVCVALHGWPASEVHVQRLRYDPCLATPRRPCKCCKARQRLAQVALDVLRAEDCRKAQPASRGAPPEEPPGKNHCGDEDRCERDAYAADACDCACDTRCGPWNEYLEAKEAWDKKQAAPNASGDGHAKACPVRLGVGSYCNCPGMPAPTPSDDRVAELRRKLGRARGMLYAARAVLERPEWKDDCTPEDITKALAETADDGGEWPKDEPRTSKAQAWKGKAEDGSVGYDLDGRACVTFAADGDVEIVIRRPSPEPTAPNAGVDMCIMCCEQTAIFCEKCTGEIAEKKGPFPVSYEAHGINVPAPTPSVARKQEVIEQLCKMMGRAWQTIDPNAHDPCDCVCRDTGVRYQNAGHALTFMEEAISEAIAKREKSAADSSSVDTAEDLRRRLRTVIWAWTRSPMTPESADGIIEDLHLVLDQHAAANLASPSSGVPIDGPGSHRWDLAEMRAQAARANRLAQENGRLRKMLEDLLAVTDASIHGAVGAGIIASARELLAETEKGGQDR